MGTNWKMHTMDQFIDSLTYEKEKNIHMVLIKDPKSHSLTMHDEKRSSKQKGKGKSHPKIKKEGYSKPFKDSSCSKQYLNS
jgi:hypothetical protein